MKVIWITMGEPAGIGPELIEKWLKSGKKNPEICYVISGSRDFLNRDLPEFNPDKSVSGVFLRDHQVKNDIIMGEPSAESGKLSFLYLETAVESVMRCGGTLVTMPICKESWAMAGINFPGHTEYLKEKSGACEVLMLFVGDFFSVALSTIHVPLKNVPEMINAESIFRQLRLIAESSYFGENPVTGVLGLNPHCGESGLFGLEEKIILEGIRSAQKAGIEVIGPLVPDAFFKTECDCYLAMYHDQGLIPFKMKHGLCGANITLGLPFKRISVSHGTGFDIAGKKIASAAGMNYCIKLAEV